MKIMCVDFQYDFSHEGGKCYEPRACVPFIKEVLMPYLTTHQMKVAEIVSDYRLPHPYHSRAVCIPGEVGYTSEIPDMIKYPEVWIKAMNSPGWIREHGGDPTTVPGLPYPAPHAFTAWLKRTVGAPEHAPAIVLIGLTLDCCVLCTAQELCFRGYRVYFLVEGVDAYSGCAEDKQALFKTPLTNWGTALTWEQFVSLSRNGNAGPLAMETRGG